MVDVSIKKHVLFSLLFALVLYFFAGIIATAMNNSRLEIGLKWFACVPLLILPTLGLKGILSTLKKTFLLALYQVLSRSMILISVLGFVYVLGYNYMNAIYGWIVASFIALIAALLLIKKVIFSPFFIPLILGASLLIKLLIASYPSSLFKTLSQCLENKNNIDSLIIKYLKKNSNTNVLLKRQRSNVSSEIVNKFTKNYKEKIKSEVIENLIGLIPGSSKFIFSTNLKNKI